MIPNAVNFIVVKFVGETCKHANMQGRKPNSPLVLFKTLDCVDGILHVPSFKAKLQDILS